MVKLLTEKIGGRDRQDVGSRNLWRASVESALREAKSLQAFCKGRFRYSQYEGALEDLIRALEMDAVTASNM